MRVFVGIANLFGIVTGLWLGEAQWRLAIAPGGFLKFHNGYCHRVFATTPRHARPATEVAATSTKSAFADSLSTFSLRFTANSPVKCLFCILNLHLSFEFQKSLAAEGRLRKGSLRLAKYAVSL